MMGSRLGSDSSKFADYCHCNSLLHLSNGDFRKAEDASEHKREEKPAITLEDDDNAKVPQVDLIFLCQNAGIM